MGQNDVRRASKAILEYRKVRENSTVLPVYLLPPGQVDTSQPKFLLLQTWSHLWLFFLALPNQRQ